MLKKETIEQIAGLLRINANDLAGALRSREEIDLSITEELFSFTDRELSDHDRRNIDAGKIVGRELGMKDVKKAAGLPEDAPSKDLEKLAIAIIEKAKESAQMDPGKKAQQLTEQIGLLNAQMRLKETELQEVQQERRQSEIDNRIVSSFPSKRIEDFSDDEFLSIIKRQYSFSESDGKLIATRSGEQGMDVTSDVAMRTLMQDLFDARKWVPDNNFFGRGGTDSIIRAGYSKKSEVVAAYEAQGKNINGEHGVELLAELTRLKKEDPSFDLEN